MRRLNFVLVLVLFSSPMGPAFSVTPDDRKSCKRLWDNKVETLASFEGQLEDAWQATIKEAARAAEIFATLRNWAGHSVDFSKCADLLPIAQFDLETQELLSDYVVSSANCGLSYVDLQLAGEAWYANVEAWKLKAKNLSGEVLVTTNDMREIVQKVELRAGDVATNADCSGFDSVLQHALDNKSWAENMINNPALAE
ncbi:MAG: hypothetical protein AAF198_07185 [Pseudomonadota bacterium]